MERDSRRKLGEAQLQLRRLKEAIPDGAYGISRRLPLLTRLAEQKREACNCGSSGCEETKAELLRQLDEAAAAPARTAAAAEGAGPVRAMALAILRFHRCLHDPRVVQVAVAGGLSAGVDAEAYTALCAAVDKAVCKAAFLEGALTAQTEADIAIDPRSHHDQASIFWFLTRVVSDQDALQTLWGRFTRRLTVGAQPPSTAAADPAEVCALCYEPAAGGIKLLCGHSFHWHENHEKGCCGLEEWVEKSCPTCRRDYSEDAAGGDAGAAAGGACVGTTANTRAAAGTSAATVPITPTGN